jgi:hypothetical protein
VTSETAASTRARKPDGRTKPARRLRSLIKALTDGAGGEAALGLAELELIRAAALAITRVRSLQDQIELGADVNDAVLVKLLNGAARVLAPIVRKGQRSKGDGASDLRRYLESRNK